MSDVLEALRLFEASEHRPSDFFAALEPLVGVDPISVRYQRALAAVGSASGAARKRLVNELVSLARETRSFYLADGVAGSLLDGEGQVAEALELRTEALPRVPRWYPDAVLRILGNIAEDLVALGRLDEARSFAEHALSYDPRHPYIRDLAKLFPKTHAPKMPDADRPTRTLDETQLFYGIGCVDFDPTLTDSGRSIRQASALRLCGRHEQAGALAELALKERSFRDPRDEEWARALVDATLADRKPKAAALPDSPKKRLAMIARAAEEGDEGALTRAFHGFPGSMARREAAAGLVKLGAPALLPAMHAVAEAEQAWGRGGNVGDVRWHLRVASASPFPTPKERGAALIERVIDRIHASPVAALKSPVPLDEPTIGSLRLAGDVPLSPSLARWLLFDARWLGFGEGVPEPIALAALLERHFPHLRRKAPRALDGAAYVLPHDGEQIHFLWVGTADERGEFPVMMLAPGDEGVFFSMRSAGLDVYLAELFGVLSVGPDPRQRDDWAEAANAVEKANLGGKTYVELR